MINFQTPIVSDGQVYAACTGPGGGLSRLGLVNGRMTATPVYVKPLPGEKGGSVLVNGHIYSTNSQALVSADFLEQTLAAVPGLEQINSTASEGNGNVRLNFAWGSDLNEAADEVRRCVGLPLKSRVPRPG